jgi:two-component system sensor histidine kinase BaeS
MQHTVEQLLALARADAGQPSLPHEPCRLDTLAHQVVEALQPMADGRGIQLTCKAEPLTVSGDPHRLKEALTNLVANAIHYNVDQGQVWITVASEAGRAVIRVRDNGVGIAPEHLPRIFDRFYRVDPARRSGAGGAGLGLAVARAITEQHGGTLSCDSVPGAGSTFTLTLHASSPV